MSYEENRAQAIFNSHEISIPHLVFHEPPFINNATTRYWSRWIYLPKAAQLAIELMSTFWFVGIFSYGRPPLLVLVH